MSSQPSPATQLNAQIAQLKQRVANDERRWWPNFLFHHTAIENVPSILASGALHSREWLREHAASYVDIAHEKVIRQTRTDIRNTVRLYFRPLTPTQYYVEGVQSRDQKTKYPELTTPCIVFLLFDALAILKRDDVRFSAGNLARANTPLLSGADNYRTLPWEQIYHTGSIPSELTDEIVFHRSAEVVIPRQLDLSSLRHIVCRSPAEKETLLALLPTPTADKFADLITASARRTLFYNHHTYALKADLTTDAITIHVSPETQSLGPFDLRITVTTLKGEFSRLDPGFIIDRRNPVIHIPLKRPLRSYDVKVELDANLLYLGSFDGPDTLF